MKGFAGAASLTRPCGCVPDYSTDEYYEAIGNQVYRIQIWRKAIHHPLAKICNDEGDKQSYGYGCCAPKSRFVKRHAHYLIAPRVKKPGQVRAGSSNEVKRGWLAQRGVRGPFALLLGKV